MKKNKYSAEQVAFTLRHFLLLSSVLLYCVEESLSKSLIL